MQVRYAALDAVCLLMLLDNLCECAQQQLRLQASIQQPHGQMPADTQQHNTAACEHSLLQQPAAPADGADVVPQQPHSSQPSLTQSDIACQLPADCSMMHSTAAPASLPTQLTESQNKQPPTGADPPSRQQPGSSSAGTSSQLKGVADSKGGSGDDKGNAAEQHEMVLRQAADLWGCRLEVGAEKAKPKAKKHMSRRQRAHIRHAHEAENQINDAAGSLSCCNYKNIPL